MAWNGFCFPHASFFASSRVQHGTAVGNATCAEKKVKLTQAKGRNHNKTSGPQAKPKQPPNRTRITNEQSLHPIRNLTLKQFFCSSAARNRVIAVGKLKGRGWKPAKSSTKKTANRETKLNKKQVLFVQGPNYMQNSQKSIFRI